MAQKANYSNPPYKLTQKLPSSELINFVTEASVFGKQNGYLVSFDSEQTEIKQNGISFIAKLATNLAQKPKAKKSSKVFKDPFMPPFEIGAHVCDVMDGEYRILLNKYNVVANHLLIVTAKFVKQSTPLSVCDFEVALKVIQSMNGLCYFNSGPFSGASQPHRHLQIIPKDKTFAIETFVNKLRSNNNVKNEEKENGDIKLYELKEYAFVHRVYLMPKDGDYNKVYKAYCLMMEQIKKDIQCLNEKDEISYNLIMTHDFLFIVARKSDVYSDDKVFGKDVSIAINAVTFAGSFFCKSKQSLELLGKCGPLNVLQAVTFEKQQ